MSSLRQLKTLVALTGALLLSANSFAAEPGPSVPKAKAEAGPDKCVAPVSDMRKNHMDHLLHQRDKTLRDGVRTKQFSLVECIDCHVSKNDKGEYPRIGDSGHFCSSCHNYAAVKVDCFDCHSDLPQQETPYMHSLNGENPHHTDAVTSNGELSKETLDVMTSGGKQ